MKIDAVKKIKLNKKKIYICGAVVVIFTCIFAGCTIIKDLNYISITEKYNKAVKEYNSTLKEYDMKTLESSVENIEDCKAPASKLAVVSEKIEDIKKSFDNGNSVEQIKKDTETIENWTYNLKSSIKIAEQVKKPSVNWIKDKLSKIKKVNCIENVSTP